MFVHWPIPKKPQRKPTPSLPRGRNIIPLTAFLPTSGFLICIKDLIHKIYTVGPHFKEVNNFLCPFKLSAPLGGLKKLEEESDAGNWELKLNNLIRRMN
ncbi:unnamed protein product [Calypogeia fissa]